MSDGIFIIKSDGELVELTEKKYDSESILQELIIKYPNLLAGGQIDTENPRRWLLISREMGIPIEEGGGNWMAVDHLFLDQDGIPTFVEVKRSSDTRIRREVVGQMLDYAANAVKNWPPETILDHFENNMQDEDQSITLAEIFGEEDFDVDDYWQKVESNLRIGKVRMIFVADIIPPELQRIVEFLYEQMSPAEVLAVEIKQYAGEDIKTLVPRVVGKTAQSKDTKPRTKRKWDEESFFTEIESSQGEETARVARIIYEWAKPKVNHIWPFHTHESIPFLSRNEFATYDFPAFSFHRCLTLQ